MVRSHLLVAAVGLLALPSVAPAIGIGVIGGDPPGLITTDLGNVQATGVEPCPPGIAPDNSSDFCYVFNNNTGGIITSLTFSTDIVAGLTQAEVTSAFSCAQTTGTELVGYFLSCGETYVSASGLLTYTFSGVLPPQGAEVCPLGNCAPDERGIPPDTVPTDPEFTIALIGWAPGATSGDGTQVLPNVLQPFTNSFTATPEPSTLGFLGFAFLLTVGAAQLRRRKLAVSRRSA
jgi:hypothetical protein